MSETIKPVLGVEPQSIFSKMQYGQGMSANMFSSCERSRDKKLMIRPTTLSGVSVTRLWDAVFSNSSDFFKRYHDRRKETDLEIGRWDFAPDMGSGSRFASVVTVVDVPKANTPTQLNQAERFVYTKNDDGAVMLIVHISSQTPSVPAGTSFRTEAIMEFSASSEDADCSVSVYGGCKKMNFSFSAIQYIATPRAIREMTAGYQMMLEMVTEELGGGGGVKISTCEDAGSGGGGGSVAAGGGDSGGGDGQGPGMLFQGLVLVLAVIVTFALLWSMSTLRSTMRISSTMAERLRDGHVGDYRSSLSSTIKLENTATGGATQTAVTQDQALRQAARDAQIQSLRYRWMEQRAASAALESTVGWLWWFDVIQFFFIILIVVKMFFL